MVAIKLTNPLTGRMIKYNSKTYNNVMKKKLKCNIHRPRIIQKLDKNISCQDEVYFLATDIIGKKYFGYREEWDGSRHIVKTVGKQIHQKHYQIQDDSWYLMQNDDESWRIINQGDDTEVLNLKVIYILAGTNYAIDTEIYKNNLKNFS